MNCEGSVRHRRVTRRRFLGTTVLAAAGLSLLGACTQTPSPATESGPAQATKRSSKDSLTAALFSDPATLNPITQLADVAALQVINNVCNALLSFNPTTRQLEPELATSWKQKDPTTWEFELRQGVMFHKDFGELTSEDVEFNVNYTVEQNKPRKFLYFYVKGARATGKYTVEISLTQPFAPFLHTLGQGPASMIISKKAYDQLGEQTLNRAPISTGPFEVDSWVAGSQISLKKHTKYFKENRPILDKLHFRPVIDPFVKGSLIKTGEIDFLDTPEYKDLAELRQNPDLVVSSVSGWNWDYITFNLTGNELPITKKEVRQAVGYAIDREEILKNVYYAAGQADDSPVPDGYLGSDPKQHLYPNAANVTKSKDLLRQAGYPAGFSIKCMTSDKGTLRRELELVAAQLKKVGIEVQIENLDTGSYNTRFNKKNFEMALKDVTLVTPDTDSSMYWFLHSNTFGWHGHQHPQLDSLLDQARVEQDTQKRAQLYQRIVPIALDESPYIWTGHHDVVQVWRKGLQGVVTSSQDLDLRFENAYWAT